MFLIYNIIQTILLIVGSPFLLYLLLKKKKYRHRLKERLWIGEIPFTPNEDKIIVIHAVSVGEINAAIPIIKHFNEKEGFTPILTTTTHTGYEMALKKIKKCHVFYFPIDIYPSIKKFLNTLKPYAIIIVETEIWPNLFFIANRKKIPILIINARLSEKSYKGYIKLKFLFKQVLKCAKHIAVQTENDKQKFESLVEDKSKITITGNIKFSSAISKKKEILQNPFENIFSKNKQKTTFIAGSIHPVEFEAIINLYKKIKEKNINILFITAPRHVEKIPNFINKLEKEKIEYELFSKIKETRKLSKDFLVIDTIGDLFYIYQYGDIIFIGKSLFPPGGGQNLIEPAVWEKTIVFGPYMSNFKHIADSILKQKAAIRITNENELYETILNLLKNPDLRKEYEKNTKQFIKIGEKALQKTIEILDKNLEVTNA